MNILFFLTPKDELAYIFDDYSLRQTVEKMEHHRYTSIPVLSREGKYVGAITEGDLLWFLKNEHELTLKDAEQCPISEVPVSYTHLPTPGLKVTFIDRSLDVTDYVNEQLKKDKDPEGTNYLSPTYLNKRCV